VQFPQYIKFWAKHPDVKNRQPLLQEVVFHVPYELPSGRIVYLRGKWDSVDLIGKTKKAKIWLKENKTKGQILEAQIKRQLAFDLQVMFYVVALDRYYLDLEEKGLAKSYEGIAGVCYNVVRRPLSGGRHSITQHKPSKSKPKGESAKDFYKRLGQEISTDPEYFFMRWQSILFENDITRFETEFLQPCLESICDWWNWIDSPVGREHPFEDHIHYRTPFGVWSALTADGSTEYDEYLSNGSMLELQQGRPLFQELQTCS
jgi:hypothetical protein